MRSAWLALVRVLLEGLKLAFHPHAAVAGILALASACTPRNDRGCTPDETHLEPLSDAQVALVGSSLTSILVQSAWSFDPPAFGWTSSGCAAVTGTDDDGDAFPDIASGANVSLTSCRRPAFGSTIEVAGAYALDDSDDGALPGFGHTAAGDLSIDGASWTFQRMGFPEESDQFMLETTAAIAHAGADLESESFATEIQYRSASWAPGATLQDGQLDLSIELQWTFSDGTRYAGGSGSFDVSASCPSRIVEGLATLYYLARAFDECDAKYWRIDVSFDGCGLPSSIDHGPNPVID